MSNSTNEQKLKSSSRDRVDELISDNQQRSAAWELEYGVTDTRRFDHIPFMDDDVDTDNCYSNSRDKQDHPEKQAIAGKETSLHQSDKVTPPAVSTTSASSKPSVNR